MNICCSHISYSGSGKKYRYFTHNMALKYNISLYYLISASISLHSALVNHSLHLPVIQTGLLGQFAFKDFLSYHFLTHYDDVLQLKA
jgi:hypothetical protein